jgi:hypothetical protein
MCTWYVTFLETEIKASGPSRISCRYFSLRTLLVAYGMLDHVMEMVTDFKRDFTVVLKSSIWFVQVIFSGQRHCENLTSMKKLHLRAFFAGSI